MGLRLHLQLLPQGQHPHSGQQPEGPEAGGSSLSTPLARQQVHWARQEGEACASPSLISPTPIR
ncbi:hypothetical protein AERO8C_120408 [Aeromonas veronii]|uniref:Uncharacterized protein n=1 Tax=Aeromonas veronii TaxID=654 RepID=A0A653KU38_AERVE|nr:hypothetical protein AERO8C_120408 [Aeromonas veronii]